MKCFAHSFALIAVTLSTVGCGITSTQRTSQTLTSNSSSAPVQPLVTAKPPVASPPFIAAQQSMVQQVGFVGDLDTAQHNSYPIDAMAGGSCACHACETTSGGPAACGCSTPGCRGGWACPRDASAVTPHGYAAPMVPCPPGFDPQEYLCDGGDVDARAFVRRDDTIGGLDPEDTVVAYTTESGDIEVTESNRVCVYAPRFSSVRKITGAVSGNHAIGLAGVNRPVGTNRIEINEGGVVIGETIELGHADVTRRIDAMRDRNRGVPVEVVQQPNQAVDNLALLANVRLDQLSLLQDEDLAVIERLALAAVAWTLDESVEVEIQDVKPPTLVRDQSVEGLTVYEFPDAGRLQILKLADKSDAKPGEVVTFAITVINVGDSAVEQVTLTDNLTTRLEYVADSQTASGGAEFETKANQAGSLQLIWKLTDKLRVGERVTVRFECKVR